MGAIPLLHCFIAIMKWPELAGDSSERILSTRLSTASCNQATIDQDPLCSQSLERNVTLLSCQFGPEDLSEN
jgi:hypothetical protein